MQMLGVREGVFSNTQMWIHSSVVEHFTRNEGVAGSSPAVSIILDSCVVKLCCIIYKIRIICI